MNARTISKFLLAALLAAPVAVLAQGPPPPDHGGPRHFLGDPKTFADHRVKHLTDLLSLTDEQQKQAATIFGDAATAQSKLGDQLKAAHETLRSAVKAKNTTTVDQAAAAIGNLTAQMAAGRAKSDIAFAKILTPDQQAKLDRFEAERAQHMEQGPPGGPGWRHNPGQPAPPHSGPGEGGSSPEPPGNDSLL